MNELDTLRAAGLLNRSVSTMLPKWVVDLLPPAHESWQLPDGRCVSRRQFLAACAYHGCKRRREALIGQVSVLIDSMELCCVKVDLRLARALYQLAQELYMSVPASILRTAIMLGLPLPRVEEGVMSCTRITPLTEREIIEILSTYVNP